MRAAIEDFEDEVCVLLESDHGSAQVDLKRLRDKIDEIIFAHWLEGASTDAAAGAIASDYAKEIG